MRGSFVVEDEGSRYESSFDIENLAAALERLAFVIGDVEKRYLKKPARVAPATTAKATARPASNTPPTNTVGVV